MPVPWIAVGSIVLSNLDKIMAVVKPAFTSKPIEVPPNQPDLARQSELLNRQIAELQAAGDHGVDAGAGNHAELAAHCDAPRERPGRHGDAHAALDDAW